MIVLAPATGMANDMTDDMMLLFSLAVIDYNQSVDMFYKNERFREINPILGSKPTRGAMIAFGVGGVGLTYLVSTILPAPWSQFVVDSIIASEKMNIHENRRVYRGWNTAGPPLRGRQLSGVPIVLSFRF